jgi:uncharacterized coiled-coil DUF342 family protein
MKNVPKKTQDEISKRQSAYADAWSAVNDEHERLKEEVSKLVDSLDQKIGKLNVAINALNEIRQEVADSIQEFIDDKSDNWRDGDRGTAYGEWQEAWGNEIEEVSEMGDVDIDLPEMVEDALNDSDYPTEPSV